MRKLSETRASPRSVALLLIGFSIFFLLLRLPQLLADWDGEDANGHCAAILLGWAAPNEAIFSRIDGVAHFSRGFSHPNPPYLFLSLTGKAIRAIIPFDTLHGQALTFALKLIVSLMQLCVFLALLLHSLRATRDRVPIAWIWVMSVAPVALYASNEVQPDSSTGFVFIALFFIAALIADQPATRRVARALWLLLGGFAAGLGKNEWTFCLAAALLFALLVQPLVRLAASRRPALAIAAPTDDAILVIVAAAIGLTCGNLAAYLQDPANYVGGWALLRSMVMRASILSGDTGTWWTYFREKLPYVWFHFVVDAAILIQVARRPQLYSAPLLLAFAFANTLFFSYVISSWGSFPRYFAPAFIGLGTSFLIVLLRLPSPARMNWTIATTIALVLLQSLYYQARSHYWHLGRSNPAVLAWISKYQHDPGHCVLVVDYSFVLDRPDVDFVHAPNGADVTDRYLASIGRTACPSLR